MTSGAARLFVCLELPSDVRSVLSEWAQRVGAVGPSLRLLPAESLHLTLVFLGRRPVGEIEAIGDACASAARGPAIALTSVGARWLPPRRPRVLAVSLADDGGGLDALQGSLAERLAAGGWYEPERRSYLPHVTVARAGRAGVRFEGRQEPLPPLEPLSFSADSVALMRSHLSPTGSRYEPLARIGLGD